VKPKSLTDAEIRSLPLPEKGQVVVMDKALPNFGIRLSQGGSRTFVVMLGKGRRQTIGRYPIISLSDARAEAKRILAEKVLGKVRPDRMPFDDAKADYLAECKRKNRASTFRSYKRHLDTHYPFGRQNLADVRPRDILKQLNAIEGISERHHAFVVGKVFFSWCVRQSLIPHSPMVSMVTPKNGESRDRVLSESELKAVYTAARRGQSPFHAIVALLILTGQRRGEIARLEWSWINEAERTITLPSWVAKNRRNHTFPYGDDVAQVLEELPRLSDTYVFPAARDRVKGEPATVFNGWSKPKERLDRETGVTDWALHDCGRTVATNLAALGVPQVVVEKLLNHVSGGSQSPISQVYNRHAYLPQMREAVEKWQSFLTSLLAA
jgi:integrase